MALRNGFYCFYRHPAIVSGPIFIWFSKLPPKRPGYCFGRRWVGRFRGRCNLHEQTGRETSTHLWQITGLKTGTSLQLEVAEVLFQMPFHASTQYELHFTTTPIVFNVHSIRSVVQRFKIQIVYSDLDRNCYDRNILCKHVVWQIYITILKPA
jgi:hypothetical protein